MKNQHLSDFTSKYKPTKKAIDLVNDVLKQDDSRYSEPWSIQTMVAGFIANDAISTKSEKILEPGESEIPDHKGPQKDLKRIASRLLKDRGFIIKGCEVRIRGSVADIIASKGRERIIVECGPCRIDKPINYLELPHTKLWVLKRIDERAFMLYEFTRGKKWGEFITLKEEEDENTIQKLAKIIENPEMVSKYINREDLKWKPK